MKRLSRLDRSIDLLRARSALPSSSPFLCSTCGRPSPFSTSTPLSATEKDKLDLSERFRRRIWGTDNPPGAKNPYTGSHVDEVSAKQRNSRASSRLLEDAPASQQKPVEIRVKHADQELLDAEYEPASSWDGLDVMGEIPQKAYFFEGFISGKKSISEVKAAVAVHRSLVEVLVAKEAGLPLTDIGRGPVIEDLTQEVQISVSVDGQLSLQFPAGGVTREEIIYSLTAASEAEIEDETAVKTNPTESEEDVAADRSTIDPLHPDKTPIDDTHESVENEPTESEQDVNADRSEIDPLEESKADASVQESLKALVASWDPAWQSISLADPEFKFAIIKRTSRLTSIRILDPNIHAITTPSALLSTLITRPIPRKLVQTLKSKDELISLPNVKIIGRKVTDIDKEVSVGRWKVIEQELLSRGLPVYSNAKERKAGTGRGL